MRSVKKFLSGLAAASLLAACAGTSQVSAAGMESFNAAYEAAEAARKRAASVGFEWRDTAKMLKQAKAAAEKGDYEKAEKLAMEAKFQGEAAYKQSQIQETAWKAAVVR